MIDRVSGQYSGFKVVPGYGPISDTDGWKKLATYLRALRTEWPKLNGMR